MTSRLTYRNPAAPANVRSFLEDGNCRRKAYTLHADMTLKDISRRIYCDYGAPEGETTLI